MTGNTYDWTSSLYCPYPYEAGDGREDSVAEGRRVARGGFWSYGHKVARAATRICYAPENRHYELGIRVTCSIPIAG